MVSPASKKRDGSCALTSLPANIKETRGMEQVSPTDAPVRFGSKVRVPILNSFNGERQVSPPVFAKRGFCALQFLDDTGAGPVNIFSGDKAKLDPCGELRRVEEILQCGHTS